MLQRKCLKVKFFVDKKDLKGVPKETIEIMKQLAIDNGKPDKYLIALSIKHILMLEHMQKIEI